MYGSEGALASGISKRIAPGELRTKHRVRHDVGWRMNAELDREQFSILMEALHMGVVGMPATAFDGRQGFREELVQCGALVHRPWQPYLDTTGVWRITDVGRNMLEEHNAAVEDARLEAERGEGITDAGHQMLDVGEGVSLLELATGGRRSGHSERTDAPPPAPDTPIYEETDPLTGRVTQRYDSWDEFATALRKAIEAPGLPYITVCVFDKTEQGLTYQLKDAEE